MGEFGGRRFEDADLRDNPKMTEEEQAELDAGLQQMVAGFPKIIRGALDKAKREEEAKTEK